MSRGKIFKSFANFVVGIFNFHVDDGWKKMHLHSFIAILTPFCLRAIRQQIINIDQRYTKIKIIYNFT